LILIGFLARQPKFDFINIGSHNAALQTNNPSQVEGDIAASATDLQALHSGPIGARRAVSDLR
jgi:hypothetical protein